GPDSVAAPYLAAGLQLAGVEVDAADKAEKDRRLAAFRANEVASKPIGFYTWNDTLSRCFRFLRYFQEPFPATDLVVPLALSAALAEDKELLADYKKAMAFYARLTNPYRVRTVADLIDKDAA